METTTSLAHVESLAMQLPPQEQLQLVSRLCDKMSSAVENPEADEEQRRRQAEKKADELMAELDALDALWDGQDGQFDSAEEIRRMREERDEQICPSK